MARFDCYVNAEGMIQLCMGSCGCEYQPAISATARLRTDRELETRHGSIPRSKRSQCGAAPERNFRMRSLLSHHIKEEPSMTSSKAMAALGWGILIVLTFGIATGSF